MAGGRVTPGVVRIGDTVRRPVRGDRSLAHRLLKHLEAVGFAGAPRFLGFDSDGREILSWLPGEVPADLGRFSDRQIAAAARLLRAFHDATIDFEPDTRPPTEVICHNDWGPVNTVIRDGLPVAMIDFDTVAPGPRLWDLGHAAWLWLDLGNPNHATEEQVRRLRLFATAYGHDTCSAERIALFAVARQAVLARSADQSGERALADWSARCATWTVSHLVGALLLTDPGG